MNQYRASFRDHICTFFFTRFFSRFAKNNVRAVTLDRAHLHLRGVRGHHDVRPNAPQFRRARYRCTVIARRMRCDPAPRGYSVKRKHGVRRSARFERADLLKILALKKQQRPARFVQSLACQHRGAMNVRTNPLMRRADAIEVQLHG